MEKPTDEELREQIKLDWKNGDFIWWVGLLIGIVLIIFGRFIYGLILGFSLFILSNQSRSSQKLDKIRLEIRELKGGK